MDSQRYVSIGDGNAYLVAEDPLEDFDAVLSDMILDDLPILQDVQQLQFSGAFAGTVQYIEDSPDTYCSQDVYFLQSEDGDLPLDTQRVESYLDTITYLGLSEYATYNATQEELESYGLDTPELSIQAEYTVEDEDSGESSQETFVLHISRDPAQLEALAAQEAEAAAQAEEQLEEGDIRIELPFMLTVKKTGDLDPNAQTFSFVAEEFGAPVDYTLVQSTLDTNGVGVYNGSFVFTIRESDKDNLREGFVFRQVRGSAAGWTYDETKFYVEPVYGEDGDTVEFWNFYLLGEDGMPMEENRPNGVSFTNSYYAEKTVEPSVPAEPSAPSAPAATAVPTNSNVPQTGDDSNLAFWIVLLLAGGCGAVIAGFRKKGNSDEE